MDTNTIIYVSIFIIAIVILSFPLKCILNNREGFGTYNSYNKKFCSRCSGLDSYACANCYTCGLATDANGVSVCTDGDSTGPFYADTSYWTYSDPSIYFPQTHRFPMIYSKSMYPYSKTYPMKALYPYTKTPSIKSMHK